jgi:hypothetical protein
MLVPGPLRETFMADNMALGQDIVGVCSVFLVTLHATTVTYHLLPVNPYVNFCVYLILNLTCVQFEPFL